MKAEMWSWRGLVLPLVLFAAPAQAQTGWANAGRFDESMLAASQAFDAKGAEAADRELDMLEIYWGGDEHRDPIALARIEYERGRVDLLGDKDQDAVDHFTRSLAGLEAHREQAAQFIVEAYRDRGSAYWGQSRLDLAEADAREAVALSASLAGVDANTRSSSLFELAQILGARFKARASSESLKQALAIATRDPQTDQEAYAEMVSYLLNRETLEEGQSAAMLAVARQAIATIENRTAGPSAAVASLHSSLAAILEKLGEPEQSVAENERALEIIQAFQQGDGRDVAMAYINEAFFRHNLANTLRMMKRFEDAQIQIDKMGSLISARLPDGHPVRLFMARVAALNLIDLGKKAAGLSMLTSNYERCAEKVAPTELRLIAWQKDIADQAYSDGRIAEAASFYEKAIHGLQERARERRSDAIVSNREWKQQRAIYLGMISTAAKQAGL